MKAESSATRTRALDRLWRQSTMACLIILAQAGVFGLLAEGVVFPILVGLISIPAVFHERRWEISSQTLALVDLGLAGVCAMHWYFAPCELRQITSFMMYSLVHAAAEFFLLVQVARLWSRPPERKLPAYLPMLAILVLICLGDIDATRRQRLLYQDLVLLVVGLTCLFYAQARRVTSARQTPFQTWLRLSVSVAVLMVTWYSVRAGNAWLRTRWDSIENWIARVSGQRMRMQRRDTFAGFSGFSTLDSVRLVKNQMGNHVALRIQSSVEPNYLRGAVYEKLNSRGWEWNGKWQPLSSVRSPIGRPAAAAKLAFGRAIDRPPEPQRFRLRPGSATQQRMTMWRDTSVERFTFLPLEATVLEASTMSTLVDRHGVISGDTVPPDLPITVWVPNSKQSTVPIEPLVQPPLWDETMPFRLSDEQHSEAFRFLVATPENVNPEIAELRKELFADADPPAVKVAAVKKFFSTFKYAPGIEIPPDRDPMTYFLLQHPAAHCEYFATGTALLLKLGNVPCRYVLGYAGAEFNPYGKYWMVRQSSAHAWVEAYLPEVGWTIVETTPSAGLPNPAAGFDPWHIWDDINMRGQVIRSKLAENTLTGTLEAIRLFGMTLFTTIPGWLLSGGVLFLLIRQIPWRWERRTKVQYSAEVLDLRRLLEQLDACLRRWKLQREPHETLHQFADRLRSTATARPEFLAAADWYAEYATVRYADTSETEQPELRLRLADVCQMLSAQSR